MCRSVVWYERNHWPVFTAVMRYSLPRGDAFPKNMEKAIYRIGEMDYTISSMN